MRYRRLSLLGMAAVLVGLTTFAAAAEKQVVPMLGGVIIDGYDFKADIGPKGSIAFDAEAEQFVGAYNGLKMPKGRRAMFAWVHDTVNRQWEYLGPVGWL